MRNRMLSIILSFVIILSIFTNNLVVSAVNDSSGISVGDSTEPQGNGEPATPENDDPAQGGEQPEEVMPTELIEIVYDNLPRYYGQELPDFSEVENGKPKWYHFETVTEDGMIGVQLDDDTLIGLSAFYGDRYKIYCGNQVGIIPSPDESYTYNIEIKNDGFNSENPIVFNGKKYVLNGELTKTVTVTPYDPIGIDSANVGVALYGRDGKLFMKTKNANYYISQSSNLEKFDHYFEVKKRNGETGSIPYYFRNINKSDSEYYGAVSIGYVLDVDYDSYGPYVDDSAVIDIGKDSYLGYNMYNKGCTLKIVGHAYSETVSFTIYNNDEVLYTEPVVVSETSNQADKPNEFRLDVPINVNTTIGNISVEMNDGYYTTPKTPLSITINEINIDEKGLVVENKAPKIRNLRIDDGKGEFAANISDDTKLYSVEYKIDDLNWDNQNKTWQIPKTGDSPNKGFRTYYVYSDDGDSFDGEFRVNFTGAEYDASKNTFDYYQTLNHDGKAFETYNKDFEGNHKITIRAKDMAGNVKVSQLEPEKKYDKLPPRVTNIVFRYEKNGKWVDCTEKDLRCYKYGNFSNRNLRLCIYAEDVAQDGADATGIKEVKVFANGEVEVNTEMVKDTNNVDYYYCVFEEGFETNKISICLSDNSNHWAENTSLLDIVNGLKKENVKLGALQNMSTNEFLINDTVPFAALYNNDESIVDIEIDKAEERWFGLNEAADDQNKIKAAFDDSSSSNGIAEVVLKAEHDGSTFKLMQLDYTTGSSKVNESTGYVSIKELLYGNKWFKGLPEGKNILTLTVTDNCGNIRVVNSVINVDWNAPQIDDFSCITPPDYKNKTEIWYKDETEPVIALDITESHVKEVRLIVNNRYIKVYKPDDLEVDEETGAIAVRLNLATETDSSGSPFLQDNQIYNVQAQVVDMSGNASSVINGGKNQSFEPVILHIDHNNPSIDDITIEKTSTAAEKVLRIVTFGIFSNDRFRITIYPSDTSVDGAESLINNVKVSVDGGQTFALMTKNGDESNSPYIYEVPQSSEVYEKLSSEEFYGNLVFCAEDNVGRTTYAFKTDGDYTINAVKPANENEKNHSGDDSTKSNTFHVEAIKPIIKVDLPAADAVVKDESGDERSWYRYDETLDRKFKVSGVDNESGLYSLKMIIRYNDAKVKKEHQYVDVILDSKDRYSLSSVEYTQNKNNTFVKEYSINELYRTMAEVADGEYRVEIVATDFAGNQSSYELKYSVDARNPSIDRIDFSIPSADGIKGEDAFKFIEEWDYGYYFKQSMEVKVSMSDVEPSSGLKVLRYRMDSYENGKLTEEGEYNEVSISSNEATFVIPENYKGRIFLDAFDNVGNHLEREITPEGWAIDTPERHEKDNHISTSFSAPAGYSTGSGQMLYDQGVTVTAVVEDKISGIRSVSYSMTSEKGNSEDPVVTVANTGHKVGDTLDNGWRVAETDRNIVTRLERDFDFNSDNNDIQINLGMVDRANNSSTYTAPLFSIDQTAPTITVAYENAEGNDNYFRNSRTMVVTVKERNFDASKIDLEVKNAIGSDGRVSLQFGLENNTNDTYTAKYTFTEGDFTVDITGKDICNHDASVQGLENDKAFYVDATDPTIDVNLSGFTKNHRSNKTITADMTITEHNFSSDKINLKVFKAPAGTDISYLPNDAENFNKATNGMTECTSEIVEKQEWTEKDKNNTDIHSLSIKFNKDYVYYFILSGEDKSGRKLKEYKSIMFEYDNVIPVLKTPENKASIIYTAEDTSTTVQPIEFFDTGFQNIEYKVTHYTMVKDNENHGQRMNIEDGRAANCEKKLLAIDADFSIDGIYEVKCVAYDKTGNRSEETVHTYVMQKESDFIAYIPDTDKEKKTGFYAFDNKGINSDRFPNIEVVAYVLDSNRFFVELSGEELEKNDSNLFEESEQKGKMISNSYPDDYKINKVTVHKATIKPEYFKRKYEGENIDIDLSLNACSEKHQKGTSDVSKITLARILIDNVPPTGEYAEDITNMGFFDGFYSDQPKTLVIQSLSPDIDINSCEILVNDKPVDNLDYDPDANTIKFVINTGFNDIKTTLCDLAGNKAGLPTVKHLYVGTKLARWWYLYVLGGLLILGLISVPIILIVKRKRRTP